MELPLSLMRELVGEGELQVDEIDLFVAVQTWVERSPHERRQHIHEVASCVYEYVYLFATFGVTRGPDCRARLPF